MVDLASGYLRDRLAAAKRQQQQDEQAENGNFWQSGLIADALGHLGSAAVSNIGGLVSGAGLHETGKLIEDKAAAWQRENLAPERTLAESDGVWDYISNPGGMSADAGNLLGSEAVFGALQALAASAIPGGQAVAAGKAASLLGKAADLGRRIASNPLHYAASSILPSAAEATMERGAAINDALREGYTEEQAEAMGDKVFAGNFLGLPLSNAAQALLFSHFLKTLGMGSKEAGKEAVRQMGKKAALAEFAKLAAGRGLSLGSEAYEEGMQQGFQRQAQQFGRKMRAEEKGEEFNEKPIGYSDILIPPEWDESQWAESRAAASGMIPQALLGLGWGAYRRHQMRNKAADEKATGGATDSATEQTATDAANPATDTINPADVQTQTQDAPQTGGESEAGDGLLGDPGDLFDNGLDSGEILQDELSSGELAAAEAQQQEQARAAQENIPLLPPPKPKVQQAEAAQEANRRLLDDPSALLGRENIPLLGWENDQLPPPAKDAIQIMREMHLIQEEQKGANNEETNQNRQAPTAAPSDAANQDGRNADVKTGAEEASSGLQQAELGKGFYRGNQPNTNGIQGGKTTVETDGGEKVDAKYRLVEAGDLVTSHNPHNPKQLNTNYPQDAQRRDRTRSTMENEVWTRASQLDPQRVADGRNVNQGAPVVRPDNVVLNGNGRSMSITLALTNEQLSPKTGAAYRQYLAEHAPAFGFTPEQVKAMKNPVLVRALDKMPIKEIEDAITSADTGGAKMSASELARDAAYRLKNAHIFDLYADNETGNLQSKDNRNFVSAVLGTIARSGEMNTFYTSDGNSFTQDAIDRVKHALFYKAYGDDILLEKTSESLDGATRNVTTALVRTAPSAARFAIEHGGNDKGLTPGKWLAEAARLYDSIKTSEEWQGNVEFFLESSQLPLGEEYKYSEEGKAMLPFIEANKRSANRLTGFFRDIVDSCNAEFQDGTLAGFERESRTAAEIIADAAKRNAKEEAAEKAPAQAAQAEKAEAAPAEQATAEAAPTAQAEQAAPVKQAEQATEKAPTAQAETAAQAAPVEQAQAETAEPKKATKPKKPAKPKEQAKPKGQAEKPKQAKPAKPAETETASNEQPAAPAKKETTGKARGKSAQKTAPEKAAKSAQPESLGKLKRGNPVTSRKQLEQRIAGILGESKNKAVRTAAEPTAKLFSRMAERLVEMQKNAGDKDASIERLAAKWNLNVDAQLDSASLGQTRFEQMAGEAARTVNEEQLKLAKKMDKAGADRKSIFAKTGWQKGADGSWRFYIPDRLDGFKLNALKKKADAGKATFLSTIYDNAALFEAYPQLRRLRVLAVNDKNEDAAGWADYDEGTITINLAYGDEHESKLTAVHEIQHIIQGIEGFSIGGDPSDKTTMGRLANIDPNKITDDEAYNTYRNLHGEVEARQAEELAEVEDEIRGTKGAVARQFREWRRDAIASEEHTGAYIYFGDAEVSRVGDDARAIDTPAGARRMVGDIARTMAALSEVGRVEQRMGQGEAQGATSFEKGSTTIDIYEAADQSTVLHELGHLFLEEYRRLANSAQGSQIAKDMEQLVKWAAWTPDAIKKYKGTKTEAEFRKRDTEMRAAIKKWQTAKKEADKANSLKAKDAKAKTDAKRAATIELKRLQLTWMHERFCRGFEEYLRTGETETNWLKEAFEKFKEWLSEIYHNVAVGDKFSPEVREIVRKMVGEDEVEAKDIVDATLKDGHDFEKNGKFRIKTSEEEKVHDQARDKAMKKGSDEATATKIAQATVIVKRCEKAYKELRQRRAKTKSEAERGEIDAQTSRIDELAERCQEIRDQLANSTALNADERYTQREVAEHWRNAKQVADGKLTPQEKKWQELGKLLGLDVKFFDGVNKFLNGRVNVRTGEMYLNRNAAANIGKTFWHETFHPLIANNPQLMRELKAAVQVSKDMIDKYRNSREDLLTFNDDAVLEEILADNTADAAKRLQLFRDVAKKDRGLIERFIGWIKNMMDKFASVFNNPTGKLTNAQRDNMARVLAKMAGELQDGNGNKIFKVDSAGNIALSDGRPLPTASERATSDDGGGWENSTSVPKIFDWALRALAKKLGIIDVQGNQRIKVYEDMSAEASVKAIKNDDVRRAVQQLLDENAETGASYLPNQLKSLTMYKGEPKGKLRQMGFSESFVKALGDDVVKEHRQAMALRRKDNYIGPLDSTVWSPERLADKYPIFRPLFNAAHKAQRAITNKRNEYFKEWKAALEICDGEEGIADLLDVLKLGDDLEKNFTDADLTQLGVSANVTKAYKMARQLMKKVHDELDAARRHPVRREKKVKAAEYAELQQNKFVNIIDYDQTTGEIAYDETPNYERSYTGLSQQRFDKLKNSADVQILSVNSQVNKKGETIYDVRTREGIAPLADKQGYIPHFFYEYMVRIKSIDPATGQERYTTIGSARNLKDAFSIAEAEEANLPKGKELVICPKGMNFENDLGVDTAQTAVVMGDKDYDRLVSTLAKNSEMTIKEAREFVSSAARTTGRHRQLDNFRHRKGAKGYSQDMKWVMEHFLGTTSRYIALETMFKPQAITYFEKTWGAFDKEYSGMAKYAKEYIQDVNGTPSALEKTINEFLNRQGWWKKYFGQRFGDRAAVYLANRIAGITAIAKLGCFNISSGIVNLSQSMNVAGYLGDPSAVYRVWRRGAQGKYSAKEQQILDDVGVAEDVGLDSVSGYDQGRYGSKLAQTSMFFFSRTEGILRRGTALVAYDAAIKKGMSHAEAVKYAREINDKANFDYSVADAPNIFRRGSIIGQLLLQFKKYPIKELEVMKDMMTAATDSKQKAVFWGTYLLFGGLFQLPFADWLDENILETFLGKSYKRELKRYIREAAGNSPVGKQIAEIAMYGMPSIFGLDTSSRTGIADVMPSKTSDYTGPVLNTIWQTGKALGEGNQIGAVKAISPAIGNLLTAIVGEKPGKRGRPGYVYSTSERIAKAIGFQTVGESISRDISDMVSADRKALQEEKQKAVDAYLRAEKDKDRTAMAEARKELKRLKITPKTVADERKRKKMTNFQRLKSGLNKEEAKRQERQLQFAS